MNLPISRDVMVSELESALEILNKWKRILLKDNSPGIPGLDYQASPEHFQECLTMFKSELVLSAGKCENLAEALHNWLR